jgi:hypothetical protein
MYQRREKASRSFLFSRAAAKKRRSRFGLRADKMLFFRSPETEISLLRLKYHFNQPL